MSAVTELSVDATIGLHEAIEFVWAEADLLDRLDYKPWLQLWTAEGLYIVPTEPGAADYAEVLNIAYDDGEMRRARVKRLLSGFSPTVTTMHCFSAWPSLCWPCFGTTKGRRAGNACDGRYC